MGYDNVLPLWGNISPVGGETQEFFLGLVLSGPYSGRAVHLRSIRPTRSTAWFAVEMSSGEWFETNPPPDEFYSPPGESGRVEALEAMGRELLELPPHFQPGDVPVWYRQWIERVVRNAQGHSYPVLAALSVGAARMASLIQALIEGKVTLDEVREEVKGAKWGLE